MDDRRFDQWTRAFRAVASRRGTVKLLTGGLLGALVVHLSGGEAAARCLNPGRKCDRQNPKKDTCCGGAKCRGKRCRCPRGRVACGKRCCAKGDICAGGSCVIGPGDCAAGADFCTGDAASCGDSDSCRCFERTTGGTRCGPLAPPPCVPCNVDAGCRFLGFPPGSSCVRNGTDCGCGAAGVCVTPCGVFPPTV